MASLRQLNRREIMATGLAAALGMTASGAPRLSAAAAQRPKPNILFILADDLGYADLSIYGRQDYETPELDRLAREGILFRQAYSNSPVCSATRVALFTGRYQYRFRAGLDEPIAMDPTVGLPPDIPNMASLFAAHGYHTSLIGKWHLGMLPNFGPLQSGYNHFYGIRGGVVDYFTYDLVGKFRGMDALYLGDEVAEREGYLTDLLADEAIAEIKRSALAQRPFMMSLHFTAPHWPWEGPEDRDLSDRLDDLGHLNGGNIEVYGEMVRSMDANIGRVLAALREHGLDEDTIVIFTSDNGGERFSNMWPFTGAKTELLEGGIRVPLIIRWPAALRPGQVSDQVIMSMDFLPTLLAAAGANLDDAPPFDGENLLPVLLGQQKPYERTLFWRYKAGDQAAIRSGNWKYLRMHGREYLFNLAQDVRERARLNDDHPEILARLKAEFEAWNNDMLPYPERSYSHDLREFLPDR